ncbi:MAG: TIGR03663 family protein [Candidatus Sumerlaeia bacterium]|nr:TIGR03663 family protein [Candidatus Sumerlaeia bacterium]
MTEAGKAYRINRLWLWALAALVVLTRFWALGAKPLHHDESLFAVYSFYLRMSGDYNFDPILHGPFLENIEALLFWVLGDSDVVARLWSALAGTLLAAAVWQLRGRIGERAAAMAVALLAVSPTLMYYSRFNRNDVPFTLAAMVFVLCAARVVRDGRLSALACGILAVAWMICIKETYVIFLFTAATYVLLVEAVNVAARKPLWCRTWIRQAAQLGKRDWTRFGAVAAGGLAAGIFFIVALHTTWFKHPEHWDGPWEAIRYWSGQHRQQRIFGEYHYYVPILLIYEFLPLGLFLWGVAQTLRRAAWLGGWVGWGWAAWSAALWIALWPQPLPPAVAAFTHMTRGWHLWLAIEVLILGAAASAVLVLERRRMAGFFVWWTAVSFLAYSYAGEKVPWIAVHIVFPMIMSAVILWTSPPRPLGRRHVARAALAAAFLATLAVALRLCFINCANPAERHVYTHTTPDYKAMVADVHDMVLRTNSGPIERFPLILAGDSIWPGQWYFRRWSQMRTGPATPQSPILILNEYLDPLHREVRTLRQYPWLRESHIVRRVPFREWWRQDMLLWHVARMTDIWLALVPKQYRAGSLTDAYGRAVGWVGDWAGLPDMTIAEGLRASLAAWRDVFDYLVFRRDFDPWRAHYPARDHIAVLLCVRKDLYRQWSQLGGRHEASRSRFVRTRAKLIE